ncbi:hypothetical protein P7C71_g6032, partial [Lecanoromycetidae sp. Uapishka_2]
MQHKASLLMTSTRGANGKILLTVHIAQVLARLQPHRKHLTMASSHSPSTSSPLANNGISPSTSSSPASDLSSPKAQRKASLFTTLRARRPEIF